jgi:hypothetical protein
MQEPASDCRSPWVVQGGLPVSRLPIPFGRRLILQESTEEGTLKTIEDLLKAKGETVRTGRVNWDGDVEYDGEKKPE